jgi:hypothetical protein
MILLEWTSHKNTMSFGALFLLSPLEAYWFCTLIIFECIHTKVQCQFSIYSFTILCFYGGNQCAHNYLWMLWVLNEVRYKKGPIVGRVVASIDVGCSTQVVPNLSSVDQVDGYNLLPNGCILATCLQSDNQVPSSQFTRVFFKSPCYKILQKQKLASWLLFKY